MLRQTLLAFIRFISQAFCGSEPGSSCKSLLDGKAVDGWKKLSGHRKLQTGQVKCDLFAYDKAFKDFDLRDKFKVNSADTDFDFGVFFFGQVSANLYQSR